jgi:hypothetical protein
MTEEVRFDVIELHPESGGEVDGHSFDDEAEALEVAESWKGGPGGRGGRPPWLQVVRIEGDTRTCTVAEHNAPGGER